MYWQKRFDRVDPNKELEERILAIHKEHKDFGYRRMQAILQKEGIHVNKKKVQRIMQKLCNHKQYLYVDSRDPRPCYQGIRKGATTDSSAIAP